MRVRSIGLLLTALLLPPACGPTNDETGDVILSYEHRSSWCSNCPHYRIEFSRDGIVRFFGLRGCAVPGEQVLRIPPDTFAGLREAFTKADFFNVPRLDAGTNVTDTGHVTIAYRDNRRMHEVIDSGSRGPRLEALRDQFLQAAKIVNHFIEPSIEAYQRLLAAGWQINTVGTDGENALTTAVARDQKSARFLLGQGATASREALRAAVSVADADFIRELLAARRVEANSLEARELLVIAAGHRTPIMKLLLDAGVDANARTDDGRTALAAAVRSGSPERVGLLLARGANLRRSPEIIHDALSQNDSGIITLLSRYGADVNAQDRNGQTALVRASNSCQYWLIEPLLHAGANPLLPGRDGRTALQPLNGTLSQSESCKKSAAMLKAAADSYR